MDEKKEPKVEDIRAAAKARGCRVQQALYYVAGFLESPMCGRCFPCSLGSFEAKRRLENIAGGRGAEADLIALKRIAGNMLEASMCKKGKDTARFLLEWLETEAFRSHIEGRCPEGECAALLEYRVVPAECTMCGLCLAACRHGAILGEQRKPFLSGYLPFEIRQKRCVKCGDCLPVCPEGAIEVVVAAEPAKVGD